MDTRGIVKFWRKPGKESLKLSLSVPCVKANQAFVGLSLPVFLFFRRYYCRHRSTSFPITAHTNRNHFHPGQPLAALHRELVVDLQRPPEDRSAEDTPPMARSYSPTSLQA